MDSTILVVSFATALNIIVVLWKYQRGRVSDAFIDGGLLVLVAITFTGSLGALTIGTIGSAVVSIYLTVSPVKLWED